MNSDKIRVAVVLAGCGFKDGSEIREAVLTLWGLSSAGAEVQCFAPNRELKEINHLTFEPTGESRNILLESARIARGKIKPIGELNEKEFHALALPGGFGAAKNLCNFAEKGADCSLEGDVERVLNAFILAKKPIGAVCIAPAILGKAFQKYGGVKLTVGAEGPAAEALKKMGSVHAVAAANEIVVDADRKVVTTPAYMYDDAELKDIGEGIRKCMEQLVKFCR